MTAADQWVGAALSIGEVLAELRAEFPETTISKLRFLETEGLVEPERTAAGYRKYSRPDVARLRYVLTAQRDHYLPLRVIREHLAAIDAGALPSVVKVPQVADDGAPATGQPAPASARLSHAELLSKASIEPTQLAELEQFGLITADADGSYPADAVIVAAAAAAMGQYGVQPRHLRAYRAAADREVGLFQQVLAPIAGQRGTDAAGRAAAAADELARLSVQLHAALVRTGLRAVGRE